MKKCKWNGCFADGSCADGRCVRHTHKSPKKHSYSCRAMPRNFNPHLGIELECYARNEEAYSLLCRQSAPACEDGSLPRLGCEFKLLIDAKRAEGVVPRFAKRLTELGAEVNRDCGFHVHMDARQITRSHGYVFLAWMKKLENWFFSLMPDSRRSNSFVYRLPEIGFQDCGHYHWVHYTEYQTVEIRLHGGTLNPHKVRGWILTCIDLMKVLHSPEFPEIQFDAMNGNPTLECLERIFSKDALEYLLARHRAGGSLHCPSLRSAITMQREE